MFCPRYTSSGIGFFYNKMIRITFLLMLLTPTFLNGESPSWPLGIKNECTKLIREGGQIACNLTGEGYAWDGYQKLFGKLPPYGFEDPHHGPVPCQDAV
uniref:Putative conserved secreted protein n=1 Tax=Ixodes ricinus TaxID=34613 RepID=A0A6B0U5C5_IXORI